MDYQAKLKEINDKYYPIIKNKYGRYIQDFDNIPDMTQNIKIVSDKKCKGKLSDLKGARGKCEAETGIIYIKETSFSEHLLVHEYIHRLSRNYVQTCSNKSEWIEGVCYVDNEEMPLWGINEVLTEWIAYTITEIKEIYNPYCGQFYVIEEIKKDLNTYEETMQAYFSSDKELFLLALKKAYGENVPLLLDGMVTILSMGS